MYYGATGTDVKIQIIYMLNAYIIVIAPMILNSMSNPIIARLH